MYYTMVHRSEASEMHAPRDQCLRGMSPHHFSEATHCEELRGASAEHATAKHCVQRVDAEKGINAPCRSGKMTRRVDRDQQGP